MTRPRIALLHACGCGWKRYVTDTPQWRNHKISHPDYGMTTQWSAANRDIETHTCQSYLTAVQRVRELFGGPTKGSINE